jgi:hypothetical protein
MTSLSVVLVAVPGLALCLATGVYCCKDVSPALQQSDLIILRLEYVLHLDQTTRNQVDPSLLYWKPGL